jgi:hypothetical protein
MSTSVSGLRVVVLAVVVVPVVDVTHHAVVLVVSDVVHHGEVSVVVNIVDSAAV